MEKEITVKIKLNGKIECVKFFMDTSKRQYIDPKIGWLSDFIDKKIENIPLNEIELCNKCVSSLLKKILAQKGIAKSGMEIIKSIKNKDELKNYIIWLIDNYKIDIDSKKKLEKFKNYYQSHPDLVISIIVKQTISLYYRFKISAMNNQEKIGILNDLSEAKTIKEGLLKLNEEFTEEEKTNGFYELSINIIKKEILSTLKDNENLCKGCKNMLDCSKVKKDKSLGSVLSINDHYPFITDSLVIGCEGIKKRYVRVMRCQFFEKDDSKSASTEQEQKQGSRDLALIFYGVNSDKELDKELECRRRAQEQADAKIKTKKLNTYLY